MQKFSLRNISWKMWLGLVLILLVLIFITQNLNIVHVNFLAWQLDIPLFILMVIVFVIGFYTAMITGTDKEKKSEKNP